MKSKILLWLFSFSLIGCTLAPVNLSSTHLKKNDLSNNVHTNKIELVINPLFRPDKKTKLEGQSIYSEDHDTNFDYVFIQVPFIVKYFYNYSADKYSLHIGSLGLSPTVIIQSTANSYAQPKAWVSVSQSGPAYGLGISSEIYDSFIIGSGFGMSTAYASNSSQGSLEIIDSKIEGRLIFDSTYKIALKNLGLEFTSSMEINTEANLRRAGIGVNFEF